jgi:hypothetical protein
VLLTVSSSRVRSATRSSSRVLQPMLTCSLRKTVAGVNEQLLTG